eukprot:TRINITY_DN103047_c0_g1_i1.p1 TRINITY_DN103047_c0_g1~~TRINITY_DN103047_c0_g1_i1.p1  ORF type:complete len:120 (-),score=7.04 TRINITY_DN103047_c0_g1_i1:4-363(-)
MAAPNAFLRAHAPIANITNSAASDNKAVSTRASTPEVCSPGLLRYFKTHKARNIELSICHDFGRPCEESNYGMIRIPDALQREGLRSVFWRGEILLTQVLCEVGSSMKISDVKLLHCLK